MIGDILKPSVVRALLMATVSAPALLAVSPAMAQTSAGTAQSQAPAAPAVPAGTSDDIVVTAQFREQRLQDTPIAITAVNAELLESRSQTNITQVANQAPSVTLKPQGASFGPSLGASIRGIGQFDFNPALEPGVGMYVDDVYYPQLLGSVFDLLDLDRVEILRGPQGTLAGKNSIGGAVKLYSKKPNGTDGGYIAATYGSRNRIELRGSADFTIAPNLYGRLSGVFKDQGGYVDRIDYGCAHPTSGVPATQSAGNCLIDKQGSIGYKALRGILRYEVSDKTDFTIIADYTKDSRTNAGEVLLYANNSLTPTLAAPGVPYDSRFICGRYCNYAAYAQPAAAWNGPVATGYPLVATSGSDRSEYEGWGVSGNATIELSDWLNVVSITSYRKYVSTFNSDDDLSPANIGFGMNRLNHHAFTEEVRFNGKVGDTVDFTIGGFYLDELTTYYTFQDIRYAPIPLQFVGNDPIKAQTKAGFAHVEWRPLTGLTIGGGLRYTDESKTYTFYRFNPDGTNNPFLGMLTGQPGHYAGSRWDYRGSVDYRFSPGLLAYASVSTGFKGGGVGPRPFNVAQVQSFGPETLTSYELGIKSDLFDRRVRLNLAGFYSEYKDIQLTLLACPQFGGPGPCALPQNAGDADIKGIEAELTLEPVRHFNIDSSISYTDFNYICVNPQVVGLAAGPCSSDPAVIGKLNSAPPGSPKWKWSVGAQYEIPVEGLGTITPRVDAAYQSSTVGGVLRSTPALAPFTTLPGYTVANARLTWRNEAKDLEMSLEVTNLFDKYYFLTNFDLTGAGAGFIKAQPGRPREWAISLKKKF